jgi:hypothetical protein
LSGRDGVTTLAPLLRRHLPFHGKLRRDGFRAGIASKQSDARPPIRAPIAFTVEHLDADDVWRTTRSRNARSNSPSWRNTSCAAWGTWRRAAHARIEVGGNRPAQPRVVDVDPRHATGADTRRDAASRRLDIAPSGRPRSMRRSAGAPR